jgi:hypothetical protein
MEYVWTGIKALLSAVLIALAIVIAASRWDDPAAYALIAFFVFLAALPCALPLFETPWGGAFLCVFVAALCAFCTYEGYVNGFGLPNDCSTGRRKLFCHIINAIYGVIGPPGLTLIGGAVSAYLLWTAATFIRKSPKGRDQGLT